MICLLQDDDALEQRAAWARRVVALFAADPALGAAGCLHGFNRKPGNGLPVRFGENWGSRSQFRSRPIAARKGHPCAGGAGGAGGPFMYIQTTNIGPQCFRRAALEAVGGWDLRYSNKGEPGIGFDEEVSWRMWALGWRTGLFQCPGVTQRVGVQGTTSTPAKRALRKKRSAKNEARTAKTHAGKMRGVTAQIGVLNAELQGGKCSCSSKRS